ncbi:hypothetical protein ACROYT_G044777 [Oculina patagonica]
MRTHTEEKLYGCPQCGYDFNRKDSLKRHLKIAHKKILAKDLFPATVKTCASQTACTKMMLVQNCSKIYFKSSTDILVKQDPTADGIRATTAEFAAIKRPQPI